MATHRGQEGVFRIGSDTVAEMRSFEIEETATVSDDSEASDEWDTHLLGSRSWSGTVTCWWDETDTNGQESMTVGASVTANFYPEGTTTGDQFGSGTCTITKVSVGLTRGQTTERTFEVTGNGALTWAAVS